MQDVVATAKYDLKNMLPDLRHSKYEKNACIPLMKKYEKMYICGDMTRLGGA
jgi:hypothetical protein